VRCVAGTAEEEEEERVTKATTAQEKLHIHPFVWTSSNSPGKVKRTLSAIISCTVLQARHSLTTSLERASLGRSSIVFAPSTLVGVELVGDNELFKEWNRAQNQIKGEKNCDRRLALVLYGVIEPSMPGNGAQGRKKKVGDGFNACRDGAGVEVRFKEFPGLVM
jgi:hypothetical protein